MNCNAFLFLLLCLLPSITSVSSQHNAQQPKAGTTTGSQPSSSPQPQDNVPGVIELTTITLDSNIRNGGLWMIEFYAPWCSACIHFSGTYAKLAHAIHATNSERKRPIYVAKVNGDKERASTSRFNIQSYPTIFVVDGWHVYQFVGSRSEEALMKFVLREGYKDQHPLPIWSSPMGPLGQVQALVFYIGRIFFGFYNYLVETKGFKPAMAAFIFAFGGMSTCLVTMIIIAIALSGKMKED
ncbi:thioredoxin [Fragilaria crotonensis]|nr:thioredoxin [Fragilaria crotonensis]